MFRRFRTIYIVFRLLMPTICDKCHYWAIFLPPGMRQVFKETAALYVRERRLRADILQIADILILLEH